MFSSTLHILDFTSALGTQDVVLVMIITSASLLCRSMGVEMPVSGAVMVSVPDCHQHNSSGNLGSLIYSDLCCWNICNFWIITFCSGLCRKYMQIHMNTVYE